MVYHRVVEHLVFSVMLSLRVARVDVNSFEILLKRYTFSIADNGFAPSV